MKLPALSLAACLAAHAAGPEVIRNLVVYREAGRYGGWPANHGAWSWGNELLVGFESGYFKPNPTSHSIDRTRPEEHLLARSLDGGEHWTIEKPSSLRPPPGTKMAGTPVEDGGRAPVPSPGGVDFTHKDFALTVRMTDIHTGPSRWYYSYDRGKSWMGPYSLPNFGQPGIAARTDYMVESRRRCTLFVAAAKANGREGRPVCVRTEDGGITWNLVSFIGPEPDDYAIMPSTVRAGVAGFITAVRRKSFIEIYHSPDDGASWKYVTKAADTGGNPPSLLRLPDGRLVLTYGHRLEPYGIRARFSADDGQTWGNEFILRNDGGTWDLGYPRTLLRPDGKLVTVYYFADAAGSERYIAATIWSPGTPP